jgi:error-prone DNA polymerase
VSKTKRKIIRTNPPSGDCPAYAELYCMSNFSFLRGASHPGELVRRAAELGYQAIAITDECSVAGIVRAHVAAKDCGIQLIVGSEFRLTDGLRIVLLAASAQGYSRLCNLISKARRAAPKGEYQLCRDDFACGMDGCMALWAPDGAPEPAEAGWLQAAFPSRVWLAAALLFDGKNKEKIQLYERFSRDYSFPLVACGEVHMHSRSRRTLQDTLTAIRLGVSLGRSAEHLHANGERHLRSLGSLGRIYPAEWLAETAAVARLIRFSLDDLNYRYPAELVPAAKTASGWLRELTERGMSRRWPHGTPDKVRKLVEHELKLIAELAYEAYFLTVYDIVCFARERGILCQGRGSAANSAVCFCLGITEVDPARMNMLVERFISRERNEPPDIDVDFEHERREEVIQYIYAKYGRSRAALTATVITYRPRSAIRDVGKALGLSGLQVNRMARSMQWWDGREIKMERVREAGLDPDAPIIRRLVALAEQLLGFPRHLSQHVGGFLIADQPLTDIVPIENAAMEGRTVIQWDKDDLDVLGLLKVDVLALGILSVIHRSFDLLRTWRGRELSLASVPAEERRVYDMLCRADTVGVFQIESRAQMAMLPRLKPRCYYDLVIEVAIIRPGPIQGDMVHPYLRRRNGEEPVDYPGDAVKKVLERTLGVPIFQEQVMQLAIVAAGFSPGEADQLRRAMAAWKRRGGLGPFEGKLMSGMHQRGYSEKFARQLFNQMKGFGEYGFPESHAASFALLVYVSAWLKCYEPAVFACALLNSQPMGFYAPAQIVQSAERQGVKIRPVSVNYSDWDCTLERSRAADPALRLGLRMVKTLSAQGGRNIIEARLRGAFVSVEDLAERAGLSKTDYAALAAADALRELAGNRHQAAWQVSGLEDPTPLFTTMHFAEAQPLLRPPSKMMSLMADYASVGVSLRGHPLGLLRPELQTGFKNSKELWDMPNKSSVQVIGLVITRQRPANAANVTFVTLEDETGFINLVIWEQVAERQRKALLSASILQVTGKLQKRDGVLHVIAERLADRSCLLDRFRSSSRDFH